MMRVPTGWRYVRLAQQLTRHERRLNDLQTQIATGKRVNRPSDDPVATGQILGARASRSELEEQGRVAIRGHVLLRYVDQAMGEITSRLARARDVLLRASTDTMSPEAQQSLAAELRGIREDLVKLGNSQSDGRYIFAGRLDQQAPFVASGDPAHPITYRGDSDPSRYRVGEHALIEVTVPGDRLFNFPDGGGERAVSGVDKDVFTCLTQAEQDVLANDKAGMHERLGELDALVKHIVALRGMMGAEEHRLGMLERMAEDGQVRMTETLAGLEDCDMAEVITKLRMQEVLYKATLGVAAKATALPSLVEMGW